MPRISWETGKYSSQDGSVNDNHLFTLHRGTSRVRDEYLLESRLPDVYRSVHQSEAEAKQAAENKLSGFVHALGAEFPES